MFDDPKKELQRLQRELLAEEEDWTEEEYDYDPDLDDDLADIKALLRDNHGEAYEESHREPLYRNYANNYGSQVRNFANQYGDEFDEETPEMDDDAALYMDDYRASRKKPKEKGIRGLVILACLETLGILAIAGWWVLWLL